ncbi:ferredoxin-thioredoxin reductase catalytic domain-containing protein [Methanospirillum sp.]|uniref:ferredoxin-thioredoxin reductase catalytic domain-containing protein n=1 Tax=Methanospirillum sp. TaxID=45200 RepID=UPI0035A1C336
MIQDINQETLEKRFKTLNQEAKNSGYNLNTDKDFTMGLVEGLLMNAGRYGYESCPCRLSLGEKHADMDIICPCDYRDDDLSEFGACFCGLYVSDEIALKKLPAPVVPERRPPSSERSKIKTSSMRTEKLPFPVYRCKVCGYLCARNNPPEKCPICKAGKERFEIFLI